ncbi:MAG TPA: proline dehydrogenase family protein [Candidatus Dormibacteraeota bacterium]|nr:proline dehydrogenase family protein [Candidatus Dormibacteraeota bacterium]
MNPLRSSLLALSRNHWLGRRLPNSSAGRRAARRFMPGERLEDAVAASAGLGKRGIACVLTELGEDVTDAGAADRAARSYEAALDALAAARLSAQISVKPTHLGLLLDPGDAAERASALAERAATLEGVVWVDMEGSSHVDATLELFESMARRHRNVGLCLQAYLRRTPADADRLLPLRPRIRLVKGAYAEASEIAFQAGGDVDAAYERVAGQLLEGGAEVAFATHDTALLARLDPRAEVQMLYGIRADQQRRLAAEGRRVRVLISYGSEWFAWYMRRLAERPANLLFAMRAMVGG